MSDENVPRREPESGDKRAAGEMKPDRSETLRKRRSRVRKGATAKPTGVQFGIEPLPKR